MSLFALVALIPGLFARAPLLGREYASLKGQYLVVFQETVTSEQVEAHLRRVSDPIIRTWQIQSFRGYAARLSKQSLESILEAEEVAYVEYNQEVRAFQSCSQQTGTSWNLDRISEHDLYIDGNYEYPSDAGSSIDVYIIDTGIRITHQEFSSGRAKWGANFADNINRDCNGHGTHVAGTVAGKTFGVAKAASVIAVKVLDCSGGGTTDGVVAGIEYAQAQSQKSGKRSVANMSLGGGASSTLDNAVRAAISAGVTFSLAAGNENQDACNVSPARVSTAITVGATTIDYDLTEEEDIRASFSNFGTCCTYSLQVKSFLLLGTLQILLFFPSLELRWLLLMWLEWLPLFLIKTPPSPQLK